MSGLPFRKTRLPSRARFHDPVLMWTHELLVVSRSHLLPLTSSPSLISPPPLPLYPLTSLFSEELCRPSEHAGVVSDSETSRAKVPSHRYTRAHMGTPPGLTRDWLTSPCRHRRTSLDSRPERTRGLVEGLRATLGRRIRVRRDTPRLPRLVTPRTGSRPLTRRMDTTVVQDLNDRVPL